MDQRVSALEVDMRDVKPTLGRMDVSLARIDVTLATLATKADVAALSEKLVAQGARLTAVENAVNDTVRAAVGKAISPWQLPGVLLACGAVVIALMASLNWPAHQAWFAH
jgi:hypothetical protein